ncbi:hypothetical protein PIB30_016258 [Stylosanthes scabra]|uniref:Uncharacterized protein n=1 Tax=Stylosanthes scabra TaxID=79078 RepID=A0ABU6Y687_9FABA|nr:hypothetical protein [Stylosanthes scabra]
MRTHQLLEEKNLHNGAHKIRANTDSNTRRSSGRNDKTLDTPASIGAVPYRTWFATVTTGTSAWGPGDSSYVQEVLVTAGLYQWQRVLSWEPGAESRTPSNTCTYVSWTRYCRFVATQLVDQGCAEVPPKGCIIDPGHSSNDSDAQYFNSRPGYSFNYQNLYHFLLLSTCELLSTTTTKASPPERACQ